MGAKKPVVGCSVPNCPRTASKRGMCSKHYQRFQKYGDPTKVYVVRKPSVSVEGQKCRKCGRTPIASGLCNGHYTSEQRRKRKAATLGV